MKTMKKSRVIVPALGLLLLSTAASVTGTVAWFTAQNNLTLSAGNFALVSTTGDLTVALTPGIATQADGSAGNVAPLVADGYTAKLTDASLKHGDKTVFYPKNNATQVDAYAKKADVAVTADYLRQTVTGVRKYSAFTWTWTFTYTSESDSAEYGLFLDTTASSVADQDTADGHTGYEGFRLAFYSMSTAATPVAEKTTVWADNRAKASCTYVSAAGTLGTSGTATISNYTESNSATFGFIDNAVSSEVPADGTTAKATAQVRPDYIGTFGNRDATNGQISVSVFCVAWYEGTDSVVAKNSTGIYDSVLATCKFTSVLLQAA